MGFSLCSSSKSKLLDIIGGHFADKVIEQVKEGKRLQGTGDNWDIRINAHDMRSTHQNVDLHYFASNLIVERIPIDPQLSTVSPRRDIKTISNTVFLLSDDETRKLREDFKVLVGRVLVANIKSLSFMKSVIPLHIPHRFQKEMAQKSIIVPLPLQLKDEKKYDDVVDILSFYEDSTEEIYTKAGIIVNPPNNVRPAEPRGSLAGSASAPDQPGAHVNRRDADDHMSEVSVPFGRDQLTRVRFAGAKDLRAGAHTAKDRFDHCSPFVAELFHTKMSFLQFIFDNLHKPESVREVGTLKFFREKYNRRNVTPDKVTKSFEGCEQFLLSVGKVYILEAALEFWGMQSLDDVPSKHVPPAGIQHMSKERKLAYFHNHIGAFVDEFVMADPDKEEVTQNELLKERSNLVNVILDEHDYTKQPEVTQDPDHSMEEPEKPDRVRFYGLNVIELAVFLMQLKDTCAEGDGDRNNRNKKRLLLYFKSSSSFTKYSIEMFTTIAQIEAIVSEDMAERLTWGRFVNWHGGEGKNIANDAAQEICNDASKNVVKGMGPNKTPKAILRASKSGAGVHEIKWSFDKATHIHRVSQAHSTRSSLEDEMLMLADLRKLRPFRVVSGRCHAHFPDLRISTTANLDVGELFTWLERHKRQIGRSL